MRDDDDDDEIRVHVVVNVFLLLTHAGGRPVGTVRALLGAGGDVFDGWTGRNIVGGNRQQFAAK